MAFRAFRSGSAMDYLLSGAQCVGVLLLFTQYRGLATCLLLMTAFAYLVSQLLTGARPLSHLLPLAGVVTTVMSLLH